MKNKIKKVGIIANLQKSNALSISRKLANILKNHNIKIFAEKDLAAKLNTDTCTPIEMAKDTDIIFSLGGDGTLLSTTRFINYSSKTPIFGINLGSGLGFLTECPHHDIQEAVSDLLEGNYSIEKRNILAATIIYKNQKTKTYYALNDITLTRDKLSRVFDFDVKINSAPLTTYKSDGLIMATPTGSTAYSLSAGGSIVDPETKAILITPICPHTLTNRPLIIPNNKKIQINLNPFTDNVIMTVDGQTGIELTNTVTEIDVKLSTKSINLIKLPQNNFFTTLRKKLNWSGTSSL